MERAVILDHRFAGGEVGQRRVGLGAGSQAAERRPAIAGGGEQRQGRGLDLKPADRPRRLAPGEP